MRGWLGDLFRTIGALWYWNLRKTLYAVRGRRGDCPCHNPSDSGRPLETRCEAITYWNQPRRFSRRVCPLLVEVEHGVWRCSAHPAAVRPFWWRWFGWHAGAAAGAVLMAGLVVFATMRVVGFDVSVRQIFWPRAWSELRGVRAEYFKRQAADHFAAGRVREAANSLTVAYEMDPLNYEVGIALTEFYHAGRPELVDNFFRQLTRDHPERRAETTQRWLRSLLGRAQLLQVAELATRQLKRQPPEATAWLHALLFAARTTGRVELLDPAIGDDEIAPAVRSVLEFEARVRRLERSEAAALLLRAPLDPTVPYARLQRIELLTEFGEGFEALELLRQSRGALSGRDVVRLTLEAHAMLRNRATLARDAEFLLGAGQPVNPAGIEIVALHLVRHPNGELLEKAIAALPRLAGESALARDEAIAALYCAAALNGRRDRLEEIRSHFSADGPARAAMTLESVLSRNNWTPLALLSFVRPLSLESLYALLSRLADDAK